MKLTLSAAMRARDVSRPREEHLEDPEALNAEAETAPAEDREPARRHNLRDRA